MCQHIVPNFPEANALPTIVDRVFGIPLVNPAFKTIMQGAYITEFNGVTEEHAVLYKGNIEQIPEGYPVILRINSACYTGDILHDASCDCNWQLEEALRIIDQQEGPGLVLYHFAHEGKGHGYFEKLKAYDGVMYPVATDVRNFTHAVAILKDLGITRVRLMTNNPEKRQILLDHGIEIVDIIPIVSSDPAVRELYDYKARVWKHDLPTLPDSSAQHDPSLLPGSSAQHEHNYIYADGQVLAGS